VESAKLCRPVIYGVRSGIYGSVYKQGVIANFIFYFVSEPSAASPSLLRSIAKGSESSVNSVGPV
jgi:hypothetical protein